ncbi:homeobox protein NANOG [Tachysurus vachellii]|uniref:homeobox protein NANOG n=1 Tax=Tachysurus vachellii TaxID=175792 RepID=UPI00296AC7D1|nr:homeobox protein NANOG [Tachysurus vachellii]
MADWKVPVSYNYSPSYHAYAYGLMYPAAPEQTHSNVSWTEAAYGSSVGVTGGYYTSQQPPTAQTPPGSPEYNTTSSEGHYGGPGGYYREPKARAHTGRLFLSNNRVEFDQVSKEQERAGSDTPSDSEVHTPDSWSSSSSREGSAAPVDVDLHVWAKTHQGNSPDGTEVMSSSLSVASEGSKCMKVEGHHESPALSTVTPSSEPVAAQQPRKAKARTAFSEKQMNALNERFTVQRYLTPVEMKTLAELTGLTYKQVKTWFQNRRMKLKRHQKDNSWVSERYITPAGIPNAQTTHSQFQVDAPMLNQDLYNNPQFRDAVFKNSPPQTPSCYLNYPRPLSPSQVSPRPQGSWCLPPAVQHYEFLNPSSYVPVGNAGTGGDGTVDPGSSPTRMATVHNATQWSS